MSIPEAGLGQVKLGSARRQWRFGLPFPFDLNRVPAIIGVHNRNMAKLVVLSAGMSGRTHELKVDKTTIGRVEDNTFQIAEPSVSSHHCEIELRGSDVVVRDLNSTNGTYINGEKITESVLKPGQLLRLGQIELRLENGSPPAAGAAPGIAAPASAAAAAPPVAGTPPPAKQRKDPTMAMQRGVSLNDLEQGPRTGAFDSTSKVFSKKTDKVNKIFLILGITFGVIILGLLLYVYMVVTRRL